MLAALDGRHETSTRQRECLPAGEPSGAIGISAGTRSASTGGWQTNGRHGVERRQAASQNASTTATAARGDLEAARAPTAGSIRRRASPGYKTPPWILQYSFEPP